MEYKIETDLNGETHLILYKNDDGTIIRTGTFEACKKHLIDIIRSRHRITHLTFAQNRILDHMNENKELSCKEFCNFD